MAKDINSPAASPQLLAQLKSIAESLQRPTRTERTSGKTIKRKTKDGYSYTWKYDSGPNSICLSRVDVDCLKELGSILERVATGENARKLFRQNERTKPKKIEEHKIAALLYWTLRAKHPNKNWLDVLTKVRGMVPGMKKLSDKYLKKEVGKHRVLALRFIRSFATPCEFGPPTFKNGIKIPVPTQKQLDDLEEYLSKKESKSK